MSELPKDHVVRLSDIKSMVCRPGLQSWCEKHNLSLRDLAKHGMTVEQLEQLDDGYAAQAIKLAEKKWR